MKKETTIKIQSLENLVQILNNQAQGKTVGLCHGVFDVLHSGHIKHFQECANIVDVLLVSVTADSHVNKGPGRPVNDIEQRMNTLAAIEYIDYVVESKSPSSINVINSIRPRYYFKGKDYSHSLSDIAVDSDNNLEKEKNAVEESGGQIYFTMSELNSSSSIINAFNAPSLAALNIINYAREFFSANPIEKMIKNLRDKKITLIGEIIFDEYIFTESLGKSGKHPMVAEREIYRKVFLGGIYPLVKILSTFLEPDNVRVISLSNSPITGIDLSKFTDLIVDDSYTNIRKTRFINEKTNTFMYEKYELDDSYVTKKNEDLILKALSREKGVSDMLIALDFGHGLITPLARNYMSENFDRFALNVQKNAGNKGFSSVSKYQRASLVVMNGEEVELELKQKGVNLESAAEIIRKNMSAKILVITDGSNGLVIANNREVIRVPAFHLGNIIDRTGAGDTLFAILSIFSLVTDDLVVLGFLGNLAGSMNLGWLANEKIISAKEIIRAVHFSLK